DRVLTQFYQRWGLTDVESGLRFTADALIPAEPVVSEGTRRRSGAFLQDLLAEQLEGMDLAALSVETHPFFVFADRVWDILEFRDAGGKGVGQAEVAYRRDPETGAIYAEHTGLRLSTEWLGRGIGRALEDGLARWYPDWGVTEVRAHWVETAPVERAREEPGR